MKTSRWLCVVAGLWLGIFGMLLNLRAQSPPWPPLVLVIASDPSAAEEGSDPAQFLVVRVGPANAPLTVHYDLGGSAVNGEDYATLSGEVTIPVGAYFAPVNVVPVDDFLIEGTESVVLALRQPPVWPPPYIVSWPGVAVATIADNDFPPTNQPPVVSLVNPPDGAVFEAYDDILLVARAFDRDGRVRSVEFFADGTSLGSVGHRPSVAAPNLNSLGEDPTLELEAGLFPDLEIEPDPGPIPVPIPGDAFRLLWSNALPGPHLLSAVATDNDGATTTSAPVSIQVLPPPPRPVVNIRATDPIASEPDPNTDALDTATFTIYRRGPTNDALKVFYRIGGTALNGVDYREIAHSVEIPTGERRANVIIAPLDDLLVEGVETVILKLVEPPDNDGTPAPADGYDVGRCDTARAVILDNDSPPNRPPFVRLVRPDDGDVFRAPANIRLAALARDFDGYVTQVEFFQGTNSLGVVAYNPSGGTDRLPPFTLVWSNVPPGHYVLTAAATDDGGAISYSRPVEIKVVPPILPPVVNIVATDPEAAETGRLVPPNPAVFQVTRTGSTDRPLVVFYRIGGTAENGADYAEIPNRVEIPAGAAATEIVIRPVDDNLVEGPESVILKLTPPPLISPTPTAPAWWYRIGSNDVARAVIRDNDLPPTNQPPRVKLVQPADGDVFEAPVDIKLAAAAYDPDGWVRTVEFFDGTNRLGIVTNDLPTTDPVNPPERCFCFRWLNVSPGPHVLRAVATDNRGAMAKSEPVAIKVLPPTRPPVVTIVASDPYASEGPWLDALSAVPRTGDIKPQPNDLKSRTATFTVTRRGDVSYALQVFYKLDGTALNGVDYRELPGRVTIPAGQPSAKIVVDPIDDKLVEGTETVVAKLVPVLCPATDPPSPGCYVVGDPASARAFIFDNDFNQSPKAEIVHPADGDTLRAGADIIVDVAALDPDGWVSKVEFFANRIKIGEEEIVFIIPPPPGQLQRFSLTWSNVPAGAYVLEARATDELGAASWTDPVRIKVADLPTLPVVTIEAIDPVATEPTPGTLQPIDAAVFQVSRTGNTGRPLKVAYRVGGTASNGVDYESLSGVVTIPSNAPSAFVYVVPLDDDLVEGTESVILTLLQPPCVLSNAITPECYLVGEPGRDIAYIRDNDVPNHPPKVALVSPPNGAVFSAPLNLRLVAAAGDADGWVVAVEFFDGTNRLGLVRNPITILDTAPVRLPGLNTDVLTLNSLTRPFSLVWSNVPPGKHVLTAVATDNAGDSSRSLPIEIAVREPGALPVVRIMATDALAREGTDNTATFRIRRTGPTNEALRVFYTIRGTASNGVDYVMIPDSQMIPAGRRGVRIVITPIDDKLPERVETVRLRLTEPPYGSPLPYYEIGRPAQAGAVILDNDHPLRLSELLTDGLQLRLPVLEGTPFRLESSTDLLTWEEEACDLADENGVSMVEEAGAYPHRFFRVVPDYGDPEEE